MTTPIEGDVSGPGALPAMQQAGSHVLSLSATINADALDPKAASKRKKVGASSPQFERIGFTASEKSGDRGSSSSLSSSESEDSSDESLATQRPPIVPQASIMPFQPATPRQGSLAVRTSSFVSKRHDGATSVPVAIPAGRYRSASSLPASSATSAASSFGSETEEDSKEEPKAPAASAGEHCVHLLTVGSYCNPRTGAAMCATVVGGSRSRSSSESSTSSSSSGSGSSSSVKPGRLSLGLQVFF